jgi:hypothetical protein
MLHAHYRFMAHMIAGFYCLLVENDGMKVTDIILKMRNEIVPEEYQSSFNSAFMGVCRFNLIDAKWLED